MRLRVRPVAAQWATRGIDWIPSVDHEITEKTYINDENLPGSISDGDWVEAARQRGSEAARRRGGEAARRRRGEAVRRRSHIFGRITWRPPEVPRGVLEAVVRLELESHGYFSISTGFVFRCSVISFLLVIISCLKLLPILQCVTE
ncbi:hypothetical protein ZIOFF_026910 [Zingiber officinale]|uniref:Uncharacterized protein n=1 Tax=Zingiber officinale TaxID=94328 RepID=A0A8J5GY33_ZINOF|nr:hypothetical protein ZIOFF_026910 [Zingiber officinale]